MNRKSRILIIVSTLLLVGVYFFPIWSISLQAPQYPEGLGLYINVSSIGGHKPNDLNSINGLNHYIGMKKIDPDSIYELKIMPYIIGIFILLGLLNAIFNKKYLAITWVTLFSIVGIIGMYDFWKWEYDYGHNLDPHAIIKIPGMSYQPPLIGTEKLLNFTASSMPHLGGILVGVSIAIAIIAIFLYKNNEHRIVGAR